MIITLVIILLASGGSNQDHSKKGGPRWGPTRATTARPSSRAVAGCASHRTVCGKQGQGLGDQWPYDTARGYRTSLKVLKRIEEAFGWLKTVGDWPKPN